MLRQHALPMSRLAPEHPFPQPVDDCYAALQWVSAHTADIGAESGLVAVGGDSAGAAPFPPRTW